MPPICVMSLKGPIARGTVRTSLIFGIRLVVQAGTLLLVARFLGPDQFGAFAGVAALAIMFGALASCGSHLVLLREMSHTAERGANVLPYALGIIAICGTLLFLAFLIISHSLLHSAQVALPVLLAIGATELWFQPMLVLASIDRQARDKIAASQWLLTLPLVFRFFAAWIISLSAPVDPLNLYAIAYIGAVLLSLLIGIRGVASRWPSPSHWRLPHRNEWRDASGFAILNLTAIGPTELDKTLALRLLTLPAAGLYAAGSRVVGASVLPIMALMLASLPRLFRNTPNEGGRKLLHTIFFVAVIYSALTVTLLLVGANILEYLFGQKYSGISTVLRWLTLAMPGMALRIAAGNALMASNHPWLRAGSELLGLATLCTMAWFLAPSHHEAGMPLALACSEWSMAIIGWRLLLQRKK